MATLAPVNPVAANAVRLLSPAGYALLQVYLKDHGTKEGGL